MKYLAYREVVENVTYSLYVREVKKEYIYDIEVKTLINKNSKTKVAKSVTTNCQKSFLLLEMLIRKNISIDDLLEKQDILKNDSVFCYT